MAFNSKRFIRKSHRYLGIGIGIQFLAWTISGLYFSWNDIDNVHGDHLRKPVSYISADVDVVSPTVAVEKLRSSVQVDSIHSIALIRVVDKPVYQIGYFSGHAGEHHHLHIHRALADAATGELRAALSKEEGIAVAKENVTGNATVLSVELLAATDGHHEFRDRPLPAWAVHFSDPSCTVYVSAELGTFQAIRHDQWRAFDFLWMFHTMDYEGRDNLNTWALKIFSILGLITVLSGFTLFFTSTRLFSRK